MNPQEDNLVKENEELAKRLANPDIYSSPDYPKLAKRKNQVEQILESFKDLRNLKKKIEQAKKLVSESDQDLSQLAQSELDDLSDKFEKSSVELSALLVPKDPNDERNAIVEIRAGAGGNEASLFAAELYRMYVRWAEAKGFKVELISQNPNEVGGFKEIIFEVKGNDVYYLLKFEAGVHRVQRIPQTESQGRIHTSTVTVAVMPEAEASDVTIDTKDLRIDVYRSSGHGGQSVNTTDSAVRITHLPTGIVVTQQDEKSQIKNREKALSVLSSRLLAAKIAKEQEQLSEDRLKLIGTGDRSEKTRTYNFPQDRITDHRIGYSRSNLPAALNGEIDDILDKLHEYYNQLVTDEQQVA
ncbi:MAG TPA: peptide chain release factor 1 [Candidatus Saccharimonadales bacterium]|nr:peptide chain release factor 1 [Candidatus Saccharimonadales bacterium]